MSAGGTRAVRPQGPSNRSLYIDGGQNRKIATRREDFFGDLRRCLVINGIFFRFFGVVFDFFAGFSVLKSVNPVSEAPFERADCGCFEFEFASEQFRVRNAGAKVAKEGLELGLVTQEGEEPGFECVQVVRFFVPDDSVGGGGAWV